VFRRRQLSKIGVAKTNGLSNPWLSPLAHAAAGAALLRTDEIALLSLTCPAPVCATARELSVLRRRQLSKIGVAKTNGLSNPWLSPLAHAAAGAALLRTDEIALLSLLCPAPDCAMARERSVFRRRQLSNIGVAKTNGLSNPRLSPLAHAAAGAALLRTDEIAPLATPPVPSPAPPPVASREPISLLALAPLPTPCRPTPVPSLLPRSLPTPKPAPVPTPATSRTPSLVPSLAPRRFHPD
jgi:hypothetical protein